MSTGIIRHRWGNASRRDKSRSLLQRSAERAGIGAVYTAATRKRPLRAPTGPRRHFPLLLEWFLGRRVGGFFPFHGHGIPLVEPTLKVDHLAAGAAKRHGDRLLGIEASAANRTLLIGHCRTTPQMRRVRLPAPTPAAGATNRYFSTGSRGLVRNGFIVRLHHIFASWNQTAGMMLALPTAAGYRKTAPHGWAGRVWRSIRLPASRRVKRLRAFRGRRERAFRPARGPCPMRKRRPCGTRRASRAVPPTWAVANNQDALA